MSWRRLLGVSGSCMPPWRLTVPSPEPLNTPTLVTRTFAQHASSQGQPIESHRRSNGAHQDAPCQPIGGEAPTHPSLANYLSRSSGAPPATASQPRASNHTFPQACHVSSCICSVPKYFATLTECTYRICSPFHPPSSPSAQHPYSPNQRNGRTTCPNI
jgi:hypothetical protein